MPIYKIPKPRAIKHVANIILSFCELVRAEKYLAQAILSRHPETVANYGIALRDLKRACLELAEVIQEVEKALGPGN